MKNYLLSKLSDLRRSVRLELIGRSADIVFFTLLDIQKELSSPNYLRRLHILCRNARTLPLLDREMCSYLDIPTF